MGGRSLEAVLRARVLAFVGPALLAVGLATLAITSHSLDALDDASARDRALAALRMLRAEQAEGDALDTAVREVMIAAQADGARLVLRVEGSVHVDPAVPSMPEELLGITDRCATARDTVGRHWRACAATDGSAMAVVAISIDAHRAVLRTISLWTAAIVLLALVGVALAARLAVKRPLASLGALAAWSERVVAGEALPAPPGTSDTSEIARLSASFDDLVRRIFAALDRERASSAHIAHELRTPLTAIRGELEALGPSGGEAFRRMLGDVDRLTHVIDAVLVLSNPTKPTTPDAVVNLADIARELAPAGTRVEAPDEALIEGDARLVQLAVRNLFDNAAKYSGHGATEVRVSRDADRVTIAVLDDGPGLDASAREKIFDRYWREAQDGAGSGLGLALVRAVAERHGGAANARPNPSGRGLEVSISFAYVVGWHD